MDLNLVVVIGLAFVINLIGALAYAARIAGVRTGRKYCVGSKYGTPFARLPRIAQQVSSVIVRYWVVSGHWPSTPQSHHAHHRQRRQLHAERDSRKHPSTARSVRGYGGRLNNG
jgi:hypothetical protein